MDIERIRTVGLGNTSHLVAAGRDAVVIDPPRDAWRVMAAAERRGWRITHVLETHVHNDYLSGALELRAALDAEILAPARGGYAFDHRPMDEGDGLELDGLRLTARATPGHTPEHLAWDLSTASDPTDGGPEAIATGGSLLVGSAGRTDLLGPDLTERLTGDQFRTLRRLAELDDAVVVLPTHGGGSFCSVGPADGATETTIGRERWVNPLFQIVDRPTFRETLFAGLGPYPTYYREMAPINRAGPVVHGRLPVVPLIGPDAVRGALASGASLVDGRARTAFAAAHIPRSVNIELRDSFASYVGWFLPFGEPLVLVLPEPVQESLEAAVGHLFRIGYDRILGALDGGVEAWEAAGGPTAAYAVTSGRATRQAMADDRDPILLDVRDPQELREDGHLPDAIEMPMGDLADRLDTLPRDRPITVLCRSGSRASIAASLLDGAGFEVRLVAAGGARDLLGR
jgi:glyoxylase-like metal-dependent hydrolase (beta-lactamase superfamily II)/rhodanese-related sulfurtransferase